MLRNLVSFPMAKLAACAVFLTACEQAADPLLSTTAPPTREELAPYFFGTYPTPVLIQLPQGVTYDPSRSYVTAPNTETVSNVARIAAEPHSGVVEVHCRGAGDVWVKVFTSNASWKIYPLTCLRPHLDGAYVVTIDEGFVLLDHPGGIDNAYASRLYMEVTSMYAYAYGEGNVLAAWCWAPQESWIRVFMANGEEKIYWLICVEGV